ncbi:hypothetical protein BU14_0404s0010 [Porphyra umbilicalis]|uniref:Uncharacterized protein n=1 Tax=Porphyra umbilicalis TaxID=2786 RepID=A0A1X6NWM6_PORUM|nr:hypothetical protein BU14_0404s0010 [Porphyra umbilicalis]|eukprot:OSX72783.1 hypothetical protein BU14_0404s0010 [Porphyra umbilicalis]
MPSPVGAFLAPAPAAFSAAGRWAARPSTGLPHRGAPHPVPAARAPHRRRPAVGASPPVATLAPLLPAAAPALAAAPAALAAHLPPAATTAVTAAGDAVAAAAAAVAAPLALAFTDPWSISAAAADALAAQLFAASLFPYLAFLYFLSRPETGCPKGAYRGFAFLLVFVFATIPAGIYAKVVVGDILANVDWLHGSAESLLTVTNLLIVGGFRAGLASPTGPPPPPPPRPTGWRGHLPPPRVLHLCGGGTVGRPPGGRQRGRHPPRPRDGRRGPRRRGHCGGRGGAGRRRRHVGAR